MTTPPQEPAVGRVFHPAGLYVTLQAVPWLILADNTMFPKLVLSERHVELRVLWRTRLAYADLAPVELFWLGPRRAVRLGRHSGLVHYAAAFSSTEIAQSAFEALRVAATG